MEVNRSGFGVQSSEFKVRGAFVTAFRSDLRRSSSATLREAMRRFRAL